MIKNLKIFTRLIYATQIIFASIFLMAINFTTLVTILEPYKFVSVENIQLANKLFYRIHSFFASGVTAIIAFGLTLIMMHVLIRPLLQGTLKQVEKMIIGLFAYVFLLSFAVIITTDRVLLPVGDLPYEPTTKNLGYIGSILPLLTMIFSLRFYFKFMNKIKQKIAHESKQKTVSHQTQTSDKANEARLARYT